MCGSVMGWEKSNESRRRFTDKEFAAGKDDLQNLQAAQKSEVSENGKTELIRMCEASLHGLFTSVLSQGFV